MSAEIINLRKARKRRERARREEQAGENRARYGRTRAEREQVAHEAEAKTRHLDGHWLDAADGEVREDAAAEHDEP